MSEMKHTPGPWITFQPRGDGSVPVRTDGLGLTICYVHDGAICDAIANARLIAAAPELLEALAQLVACHDEFDASAGNMEEAYYKLAKYAYPHWKAARAAIAKAEGRA